MLRNRGNTQITRELKQYYEVESLDDVRIIRDRFTSTLPVINVFVN